MSDDRTMTTEEAAAILAVVREDKRLPQPQLDEHGNVTIKADQAQASEIARRVWWKTKLFSPEGLSHLFPGFSVDRVRHQDHDGPERKQRRDNPSHPPSVPCTTSKWARRRKAAKKRKKNR